MFAFVSAEKGYAERDRALGMNRRQLLRVDGIESPEEIQFPVVVRSRIAQNCHLNRHPASMKPRFIRFAIKFMSHLMEILCAISAALMAVAKSLRICIQSL